MGDDFVGASAAEASEEPNRSARFTAHPRTNARVTRINVAKLLRVFISPSLYSLLVVSYPSVQGLQVSLFPDLCTRPSGRSRLSSSRVRFSSASMLCARRNHFLSLTSFSACSRVPDAPCRARLRQLGPVLVGAAIVPTQPPRQSLQPGSRSPSSRYTNGSRQPRSLHQ